MKTSIEFRTPGASFDQPVEMWLACHERVQRFAALLARLAEHVRARGADEEAQTTAASIRRYFNEAAPRHHEDEEVDMFPRLRERLTDAPDARVLEALDQVEADHVEMAQLWKSLDADLARIACGTAVTLPPASIDRFAAMYRRHIDAEEQVLLPSLQRVLSASDWNAIGRAMAERRGLELEQVAQPRSRG